MGGRGADVTRSGYRAPMNRPEHGNAPQTEPDTLPEEQDAATGSDEEKDPQEQLGPGVDD